MKIGRLILLFNLVFFVNAISFSATPTDSTLLKKRISLVARNASLSNIIQYLGNTYHLNFSYGNKLLLESGKVTLTANRLPLHKVLDMLLQSQDLSYKLIGNHLVILQDTAAVHKGQEILKSEINNVNDVNSKAQAYDSELPDGFVFNSKSMRSYRKYLRKLLANAAPRDTGNTVSDTNHLPPSESKDKQVKEFFTDKKFHPFNLGASMGIANPLNTRAVQLYSSPSDDVQVAKKKLISAMAYIQWNTKGPFFLVSGLRYDQLHLSGSLVRDSVADGPGKIEINTVNYDQSLKYIGVPLQAGLQLQKKSLRFSFSAGISELILFSDNFKERSTTSRKISNKPPPPPPGDSTGNAPKPAKDKIFVNRDVSRILNASRFATLFEINVSIGYTIFKRFELNVYPSYTKIITPSLKRPQHPVVSPSYFGFKFSLSYKL